jgi:hypothetical protein
MRQLLGVRRLVAALVVLPHGAALVLR